LTAARGSDRRPEREAGYSPSAAAEPPRGATPSAVAIDSPNVASGDHVGSVIKKRRKKMRKHKHKKMLKKTRWQRRT